MPIHLIKSRRVKLLVSFACSSAMGTFPSNPCLTPYALRSFCDAQFLPNRYGFLSVSITGAAVPNGERNRHGRAGLKRDRIFPAPRQFSPKHDAVRTLCKLL